MRTALITGASGFIGVHLTRYLMEAGWSVHMLTKRPTHDYLPGVHRHIGTFDDRDALRKILRTVRADFIVHLAGRSVPGRDYAEFPLQIESTINPAIRLAIEAPIETKLTLFCGSCEEYGNGPVPFREDNVLTAFSPYGWAKISAFHAATMVARQRGLPWCWMRPFLTFGPGQESNLLVPTLIRGCLSDREVPLSLGEQTRDLLFVSDLCRMIGKLLEKHQLAQGEVVNLCSSVPRTVRSIAEQIHDVCQGKGRLRFGALPYRAEEAMNFFGSDEKFRRLFGNPELTDFREALERTVEWYRNRI